MAGRYSASSLCFAAYCTLLLSLVNGGRAAKILVVPVVGSHWINIKVLMLELKGRGHEFTVLGPSNAISTDEVSSDFDIETIHLQEQNSMSAEEIEKYFLEWAFKCAFSKETSPLSIAWQFLEAQKEATKEAVVFLQTMFENKPLMRRLQVARFELVLADPYNAGGVMLARHFKIPVVFFGRWMLLEDIHFAIAPSPLSYVPILNSRLTDKMGFAERFKNVLLYSLNQLLYQFFIYPTYDKLCQRYLHIESGIYDLYKKADIYLMKVDFVFEFPRPVMPNAIYIGGFQCRPPKALPAEIEEFMDGSGDEGVVVVSLGSFVKTLPWKIANKMAAGLARLPERVIWRYTGDTPYTTGNNTKILRWLPQNDILSHPKTKAFVAHGGENGAYEAIFHGVPVIGFPLYGDQYENILRLTSRGAALMIENLSEFTADDIYNAVRTVIDDPSYRANMQHLSALHRDTLIPPMEAAIFWTEYVIRHKGASHLQAAGNDLPFYQYYLLDVIGLLAALLFVLLLLIWKLTKAVVTRACAGKKKTKSD